MERCPKCNCYMSYYVDYVAGQIVTGYRCSHCAYDTNNQHIIWSASIPMVNVDIKYATDVTVQKEGGT